MPVSRVCVCRKSVLKNHGGVSILVHFF